jgi:hypothetical protein
MEKVCCGGGEGEQLPSKKKRGRPRKSDQEAARITKEKKDGTVKDKKEIRHRSTEDNASKLMEYTASNQLFIKGVEQRTTHKKLYLFLCLNSESLGFGFRLRNFWISHNFGFFCHKTEMIGCENLEYCL